MMTIQKNYHSMIFNGVSFIFIPLQLGGGGGVLAQSVGSATPCEEVPGSIPTVAARSLLVGSV